MTTSQNVTAPKLKVDYIKRSLSKRKPDFLLNDEPWEMKNPRQSGYMAVWNQFKNAVYGHGKQRIRNPQSDKLVIGGERSGMSLGDLEKYVIDVAMDEKDAFPEIKEVLVITKEGIRRIKR